MNPHYNRHSHMVQEYYVQRMQEIMEARSQRIAAIKTKKQAEAYVKKVRSAVRKSFAPFPEKTPLNAQVTVRSEYKGFSIENVIYESRPNFLVTANLYLPKKITGKIPGVIGLCGHSGQGKANEHYQAFCKGLASKGFAVFIIDPISQGERQQYYPKDGGRPGLCAAHNLMGNKMLMSGGFFGTWRVWDAIRGLDYLVSRPEIDRTRLGVTGNSGGGTLSSYLTALDPRLTMAAPSCYICSYYANMLNEEPADAEQNPPGIIGSGLDHADLLICHAPRPTIILGQIYDFFDYRFTLQAAEDVKKIHRLLGSEEMAEVFIGPQGHGYSVHNREAMYKFFMKHAGIKGSFKEPKMSPIEESKLFATPKGETHKLGSKRVFDLTLEELNETEKKRGNPSENKIKVSAQKLLNMPGFDDIAHYRCVRYRSTANEVPLSGHSFLIDTEPGIQAHVANFGPESSNMTPPKGKVNLYVGNFGGEEDVLAVKKVRSFYSKTQSMVAVDPRGLGQSLAKTCRETAITNPYGADYLYASSGQIMGESYFGRRVYDVMRVMDTLLHYGAKEIKLIGRGIGSLIVTYAGLLHKSKPKAEIFHYLPSYRLIMETPHHEWPLSSLLEGALLHFDLPDIYRVLGKRLKKSEPWGADMKPLKKKRGR